MRRTSLEPLFVEILQANRYEMQAHIERFKPHLEPWIKPRVLEEWVKVGPNEGHFVPFWMAQTYATWQGQYG